MIPRSTITLPTASAAYDGRSCAQPGGCRRFGTYLKAGNLRLEALRHPGGRDVDCLEQLCGPAALPDVKHRRPRRIGDFRGEAASELEADVVLGEQDLPHLRIHLRLVIPEPAHFGSREAGEHGVGGKLHDSLRAYGPGAPVALGRGALIAPEESRPEHLVVFVEEDGAVHLTGEPDPADGVPGEPGLL